MYGSGCAMCACVCKNACCLVLYVVVGVCMTGAMRSSTKSIVCDRTDKDEQTNKRNKGRFQHAGHSA